MFDKVPTHVLSDSVAQQLLDKIENGVFATGSKLPSEAMLSEAFGVSRTVVREAISRLKNEGVLQPQQGRGIFVTANANIRPLRIDYAEANLPGSVFHLLALRRAIEAEIACEAALNRSEADLVQIDEALARIDEEVDEGLDGVRADVAFHRAIAQATGNPYFLKTLEFVSQYLEAATRITRTNEAGRADFSRQVHEEHQAIVAAIRLRDPLAAGHAARAHIYNAAHRLRLAGVE